MFRHSRLFVQAALIVASFCGAVARVSALPADQALHGLLHRSWELAEGLPANDVRALAQDENGVLWVGTTAGLARFDGRLFEVVSPEPVEHLLFDTQGILWIGTREDGVIHLREGHFRRYGRADGLPSLNIAAMTLGRDGHLLVATAASGVVVFRGGFFEALPGAAEGWPAAALVALLDSGDGLYLATTSGLYLRQPSGEIRALASPPSPIRSVVAGPAGNLWVATEGGLLHFSAAGWRDPFAGRGPRDLLALQPDPAGALWLGTRRGLWRSFPERGELDAFLPPHPVADVATRPLLLDRSGQLFLGAGEQGLHQLRASTFRTWGLPEGLTSEISTSVTEDTAGRLWVSARNAGIDLLTPTGPETDGPRNYTVRGNAVPMPDRDIWSVAADAAGNLWAGSSGAGLLRRRPDGRVEVIGPAQGLSHPSVFTVLAGRSGDVWAGTDQGLNRVRDGHIRRFGKEDGLPSGEIRDLYEDNSGVLWVGTTAGLARQVGAERFETFGPERGLLPREILDIWQDELGVMWVAAAGGLIQIENERARVLTTLDGLCSDELAFLIGDRRGYLWLGTGQGLVRIALEELRARLDGRPGELHQWIFGRRRGLRGGVSNHGTSAFASASGRLYFATRGGLVEVDPAQLEPLPPPPVRMLAFQQEDLGSWLDFAALGGSRLVFRFSATTLDAPDDFALRYRLTGFDTEWREAGRAPAAVYERVPPGNYRFEVAVSDQAGFFGAPALVHPLEVHHRQDRLLAWLFLLVATTLGLWALFHRLRIRYLQRRERSLQLQVDQALADLKVLHGMLPICSHCKKIRDDEGYWKDMESYFSSHSQLEFTRGYCPSCEKELAERESTGQVIRVVRAVPGGRA